MTQLPVPPTAFPVANRPESAVLYSDGIIEDTANESVLRRYWRIFFKHRWVVAGAVGACLAIALIVSLLMKPQYTATVRIQVAREAAKVVDMQQVETEQSGGTTVEFYQTQYALLKSRSLSEAVVRDLGLANNPAFLSDGESSERADLQSMPVAQRLAHATSKVNEHTGISPVRGSSIIDVSFAASDPALSAKVANSVAENFIESNLARRFDAAAYAREFLQNRLEQVRQKLEESERKAVEYAQAQGLIRISTGSAENPSEQSLVANNLAELSSQLTAARAARAQAEAQYRAGTAGSVAAQSLTSTTVNQLRQQRAELLGQLSKLESDFGPEYPPVVALKSQIGELDRQIAQEQSRVSTSVAEDLGGRFRQALATEQALQSRVEALKAQLLGEQRRSIQFNILQRDVDTNRALYDALLQRFKEVGIAGGVGTNNVSIVDRALPPRSPSSPNVPLNLALGLLLGLVIGCAAAIVLEQLAESVISPTEFQSKLRIPLLGSTPATKVPLGLKLLPSRAKSEEQAVPAVVAGQSELSEAYFSILTALQFSTSSGAPKTLAVTSSQQGEGKSTTAMALARGLISIGSSVLLIDADMRNPSIHRALNLPNRRGLSDLLSGNAEFKDVIQPTDTRGFAAMTAGKTPPNPAELLAGEGLEATIKTAVELFDHVIFDSPPVLGLADAPLIARAAEGTVFVIEASRTRSSQARHALDRLTAVRAHILGAVLTKLDSRSSGYGEGYGYSYKYGKG
ncbi:MAG TPA: polysaccharide biosynthesis tyrosine autokinase [Sphingomicrobium sp.]|nr:polysaccharide biosynthesis tyrosine autokinase [Sphingomicrobium sp.]